jgi:hypothetical protein
MGEYQDSVQKAEELEKTNRILAQGFEKVARRRVAEISEIGLICSLGK